MNEAYEKAFKEGYEEEEKRLLERMKELGYSDEEIEKLLGKC